MTIFISGGAGYIGSVVSHLLMERGHQVVVYDNLSTGFKESLHPACKFVFGDVRDKELPARVMKDSKIDVVMHFAAKTSVPESLKCPLDYFDNNVNGTLSLLQSCMRSGIKKFIFSSTAAVYGDTTKALVKETDPLTPMNPYGESKMISEIMIRRAQESSGLDTTIFRYFNVAGAKSDLSLGQRNPNANHLFHHLTETALGRQDKFHVFGDQFPTIDGTGVRDFIHVEDIAMAHILAAEAPLEVGTKTYNCGYGHGYSVLQTLKAMEVVLGQAIPFEVKRSRPGDPASVLADSSFLKSKLDWNPKFDDLEEICRSSLEWKRKILGAVLS